MRAHDRPRPLRQCRLVGEHVDGQAGDAAAVLALACARQRLRAITLPSATPSAGEGSGSARQGGWSGRTCERARGAREQHFMFVCNADARARVRLEAIRWPLHMRRTSRSFSVREAMIRRAPRRLRARVSAAPRPRLAPTTTQTCATLRGFRPRADMPRGHAARQSRSRSGIERARQRAQGGARGRPQGQRRQLRALPTSASGPGSGWARRPRSASATANAYAATAAIASATPASVAGVRSAGTSAQSAAMAGAPTQTAKRSALAAESAAHGILQARRRTAAVRSWLARRCGCPAARSECARGRQQRGSAQRGSARAQHRLPAFIRRHTRRVSAPCSVAACFNS